MNTSVSVTPIDVSHGQPIDWIALQVANAISIELNELRPKSVISIQFESDSKAQVLRNDLEGRVKAHLDDYAWLRSLKYTNTWRVIRDSIQVTLEMND